MASQAAKRTTAIALGVVSGAGLAVLTNWIVAIGGGVAVWFVAGLLFNLPKPGAAAARTSGLSPQFAAELDQARQRIKSTRALAWRPGMDAVREPIDRITETARAIVADIERTPADYMRLRKALTHYLAHVETIADRLAYLYKSQSADQATVERARTTLGELETVFAAYRERAFDDERFDLDTRLELLERDIGGERIQAAFRSDRMAKVTDQQAKDQSL